MDKYFNILLALPVSVSYNENREDMKGISTFNRQLIENFYLGCKIRGLTPKTIRYYSQCLLALTRYCRSMNKGLSDLTPEDMNSFILWEMGRKLKPVSINTHLTGIRVFYNYIYNEGLIKNNPAEKVRLLKIDRRTKPTLSPEEINKYLHYFDCRTFESSRNYNLILLAYDSMLRLGELLNLELTDLILADRLIRVFGKSRRERLVPTSPRTARSLHTYIMRWRGKVPGHFVFCYADGRRMKADRVENIFKAKNKRVSFHANPHKLRRSGATAFLNNGGNIHVLQHILGHSDIRTTQIYACPSRTDITEAFDKFSPASKLGA